MNEAAVELSKGSFAWFAGGASGAAGHVDALFLAMLALCGGMALLLAFAVVFLCVRYRRGSQVDRSDPPSHAGGLEAAWTVIPLLLFLVVFYFAGRDFLGERRAPPDALQVHVEGKQWMWKIQHPNGRREINTLHVPLGQAVELVMVSQDVIHSFYVPAFRLKQDLVPGRYTRMWFTPTKLGEFRLFCAEYCGTEHAGMIGTVTVMPPADYARWLTEGPVEPGLVQQGAELYRRAGCSGCHDAGSSVHAPSLAGVFGRTIHTADGRTLVADENYLRDSILWPQKDVVAGYAPVMPSFSGQFDEADLQRLIAFLRAGAPGASPPAGSVTPLGAP